MNRRHFLAQALVTGLTGRGRPFLAGSPIPESGQGPADSSQNAALAQRRGSSNVTLFLCGDVMTGRGVDQILPRPSRPRLFEPYVQSALVYVALAEQATGAIRHPVDFDYIWGDALTELSRMRPDARIVNLETAVTVSEDAWPGKGIHYRMHPANVPCLTAAKIDCCVLANNHVLDWGHRGLLETLDTLHGAGIRTAGAGRNAAEAGAAAVLPLPEKRRVLIFAFGTPDSGIPEDWAAGTHNPGVNLLADLSSREADAIARQVRAEKREGDLVVVSIHWGGNWGFAVPAAQRNFARALIDQAAVDIVHGHSSHHVKGIEVYQGKAILYGSGDFLNDYEGIQGHESFRDDLALMYFSTLDLGTGRLTRLALTPTETRHFRVNQASAEGSRWLLETLNREGKGLGTWADREPDHNFLLRWEGDRGA